MAPARARALWSLAAVLVLALVVVLVARWPSGGAAVPRVDQGVAGPVLLVPGYGGSTASLAPLAAALRAQGRDVTVVAALGDGTGDLVRQASRLDAAARSALEAGVPSVDVVGYSAGGVIARVWLDGTGADVPVRRVVTLGSPHAGSDVAALAADGTAGSCPPACQQLVPGSDLLRSLPATPGSPRWTSVWSDADEVSTPPDTAVLAGAVDVELQQVCPGDVALHGQLPRSPLPVALVALALGGREGTGPGLTTPPSPVSCGGLEAAGRRLLG